MKKEKLRINPHFFKKMKEYLLLGIIINSFGIDGTIKIKSTTTNGELRYKKGNIVNLYNPKDETFSEVEVFSYRHQGLFDFVKFVEINSKEEVDNLKGIEIWVKKDQKDLQDGYYFYSDLKKMDVYDENGHYLGKVIEVEEYPAQITLRVKKEDGKTFFVPFIKEFIKSVDLNTSSITIKLIEGML